MCSYTLLLLQVGNVSADLNEISLNKVSAYGQQPTGSAYQYYATLPPIQNRPNTERRRQKSGVGTITEEALPEQYQLQCRFLSVDRKKT